MLFKSLAARRFVRISLYICALVGGIAAVIEVAEAVNKYLLAAPM